MRRTLTKTSRPRIRAWHRSTQSSSAPSTKTNSKASLLSTKTLESWFQPFRQRQSTVHPTHRNFPLEKLPSAVLAAISSCSLQQLLLMMMAAASRYHSPHPANSLHLPPPSSCSRPQRASSHYVIRGSFELCLYCPPTHHLTSPYPAVCLPAWIPFCGRILLSWFETLGLTFKDQQAGGWLFMRFKTSDAGSLDVGWKGDRVRCLMLFVPLPSSGNSSWPFLISVVPSIRCSVGLYLLLKWLKLTFVR